MSEFAGSNIYVHCTYIYVKENLHNIASVSLTGRRVGGLREAAKKSSFLVVRPLRPYPPHLGLVVIRNFFFHGHK